MMSRKIFSSKKNGAAWVVLREGKEPRCGVAKKRSMGKGRKKGI